MKNKGKIITFIFLIIFLGINFGLIFSYFNFYLSDQMRIDLNERKNENFKELYKVSKIINGLSLDDTKEELKRYTNNNEGYISLIDMDGNIIYSNRKIEKQIYSSKILVFIERKRV